jgi:hypothetical protein
MGPLMADATLVQSPRPLSWVMTRNFSMAGHRMDGRESAVPREKG